MSADDKTKIEKVTKEINSLPPEAQERVRMSLAVYSGPIPDAAQFKKYEEALPGSAERILRMAEEQSAHRRKMEMKVIDSGIENSKRGQLFAFILSLVVIVGGLTLLILGKSTEGYVALVAALGTLVGTFIYGKKSEKDERVEKSKAR
ncbi:DUF2335 domain-containing protein [Candidatus Saccharibacteria bacterium]|nr:DUF2335 domain-containing protein [Candidatus Saccharibacteria bacterium]